MNISEMEIELEDLEWTRDATQAICQANGWYNPDYERYTRYINDLTQELKTMEEQESEAIILTMKNT